MAYTVLLQEASNIYMKVRMRKTKSNENWQEKCGKLTSFQVHTTKTVLQIVESNKFNIL